MSTALALAPSFNLVFGTKKNPVPLAADAFGVSLASGKNATEARKALKGGMPEQAANGTFAPFAGYLAATFPKLVKAFLAQLDTTKAGLRSLKASDPEAWTERNEEALQAAEQFSLRNRMGFNMLVQFILNNKPEKATKAQTEGLVLVDGYVAILAERKAAADAKRAAETQPTE